MCTNCLLFPINANNGSELSSVLDCCPEYFRNVIATHCLFDKNHAHAYYFVDKCF